ncbi:MAG TPA: HAMP domain-containing sensor histidine kinase [candidate division Zixibacteria bacterium]|nr:HAMP domain-containing sensor histidine kinase [candidate division Zixibacteria bacterium]
MPDVPLRPAGLVAPLLLNLVEDGATVPDLCRRLEEVQLSAPPKVVRDWMGELSDLGLVRVAEQVRGEARYVRTTLGGRVASAALAGRPELLPTLEQLEELRSDLVSTIAHELRTPLTAVRTSVGLLLDPGLQPSADERQQLLTTIGRSADRMQSMLTELLDLARFRAGKIQLRRAGLDARDLARDASALVEPVAVLRDQELRVDLPNQAVPVRGDRRRLEQALLNLLSNAQKFGPPGSTVRVSVVADEDHARISVRDEGPGISAEDQARLFERFFVGGGDRSGGVGLGLPTALAIAQAHGGTIEVESAPGAGSTFSLLLPLATPRRGTAEASADATAAG